MNEIPVRICNLNEVKGMGPSVRCIVCYNSYPVQKRGVSRWLHPLWVLDYSRNQSMPVRVGTHRRPWQAREARVAHLYPPETVYWEDSTYVKQGVSGLGILFTKGDVAGLNRLICPKHGFARFYDVEGKLGAILSQIEKFSEIIDEKSVSAIQAAMWSIFHLLLTARSLENEGYVIEERHDIEIDNSFSIEVEKYMRMHFQEKLSLETISKAHNTSVASLRKKFRKEQNISPMARLTEIRIDIAKQRLLRGEKACAIAVQIGFCDEYHLSKVFKKIVGQSPREYLALLRKTNVG